jgi:hypothetical protein
LAIVLRGNLLPLIDSERTNRKYEEVDREQSGRRLITSEGYKDSKGLVDDKL